MASANPIAGVEDLGYAFSAMHVALRKLCDSKITSALWNAFHVVPDHTREWFSAVVRKAAQGKEFATDADLVKAIRSGFEGDDDPDLDAFGKSDRMMIKCMLDLFTYKDWLGMLGFIIIYPKT